MSHIFISHATADDPFVAQLREQLEGHNLQTWVDSRQLRGGDQLAAEIERAIQNAASFIAVLSPETINSSWVRTEIKLALEVQRQSTDQRYPVIPILLPGVQPAALGMWFDEEPLAVPIETDVGGLSAAMPRLLAALGQRLAEDHQPSQSVDQQPTDRLTLMLDELAILEEGGVRRPTAKAQLLFDPHDPHLRSIKSRRFDFTAPLGIIEMADLAWYLEEYFLWPTGVGTTETRKERIEGGLPQWGKALYDGIFSLSAAQTALHAWQQGDAATLQFSVEVAFVDEPSEAASQLLSLPWELLHDGQGYLFQGRRPLRVRRQIPTEDILARQPSSLPIRILLVSPRPESDQTGQHPIGYFDHRASALPVVKAVAELGELATVHLLPTPTLPAFNEELKRASDQGQPYHVVHFDGHGVYDKQVGLGALCFESSQDQKVIGARRMELVHGDKLAKQLKDYGVSMIFLDACQTASQPTSSVAMQLLQQGIPSVIAMSHTVLVETTSRFVIPFYTALTQGKSVGMAIAEGQRALMDDSWRGYLIGGGDLLLQDWFVPVLYQRKADIQLFTQLLSEDERQPQQEQSTLATGDLPAPPDHHFVGRSREMLQLERLLQHQLYVVVRGSGGMGKTTLTAECTRWLVQTGRFDRAVFVSMEEYSYDLGVLDSIGRQLIPGYSVATYGENAALEPVLQTLCDMPTLIILDNMESILPIPTDSEPSINSILSLCEILLGTAPQTRIIFTSRERLSSPFDDPACRLELGALSQTDAMKLVERVMTQQGWRPAESDKGNTPQAVRELVEAVGCYARALVLLAREVATAGIPATIENVQQLMGQLEAKHPGDRENSLYASVALSLQRLPAEMQEKVQRLAVFYNGGHIVNLAQVMDVERGKALQIARALIDVGIAEDRGQGYLQLDPALTSYWQQQLPPDNLLPLRQHWAKAMIQLVEFLYGQQFQDAVLAAELTMLELSNLRALLNWLPTIEKITLEQIVDVAGRIEQLVMQSGQIQAMSHAVQTRKAAASQLGTWSRAKFESQRLNVEQLVQQGNLLVAYEDTIALQKQAMAAGESAYIGADYDIAMAHMLLGRVLGMDGRAGSALPHFLAAEERFACIAATGHENAALMVAAAISEQADSLRDMHQLADASEACERSIALSKSQNDQRGVAVVQGQLGTIRMLQGQYDKALTAHTDALFIFEVLGELQSVATAWHQIGIVHTECKEYKLAENAHQQSLAIKVQNHDTAGRANSLGELGYLYDAMGRLEDAVTCYRQAANIYTDLQIQRREGSVRNNVADTLIKLERYDEARLEITRAIECKYFFGHEATPWNAWNILHKIEEAEGHLAPAQAAWQKARTCYLAYRRDGGDAQHGGGKLCEDILPSLQIGEIVMVNQFLVSQLKDDLPEWLHLLIGKLQAIVAGSRDVGLADDFALGYSDAAEILLLLERLDN